jgi:hypothetical protein
MRTEKVGASGVVLEHHWDRHLMECPGASLVPIQCPCGAGWVQLCSRCHEELFVHLCDVDAPCEHVLHLMPAMWGES